jgi:CRP/FNR family transcriptional regulator, nitrogen oxide reductase regulator
LVHESHIEQYRSIRSNERLSLNKLQRDKSAEDHLAQKKEVFKKSSRFAHLNENDLREIAALATTCRFKKRDVIFSEEDTPEFFYIVQHGRVKLFRRSMSGKNFVALIASPGNSLDSYVLFEGKAHDLSAQAMDDVTVLRIKREKYMNFVNEHHSIAFRSVGMLAKVVNSAYERIVDLIGERVEQRVCNILVMLYLKFGATLLFTSEEIADLAGTTTETAIRELSKLRKAGIIRSYRGKITILDQTKLYSISRTSYQL